MVNQLVVCADDLKAWGWAKSHACVPTALTFESFIRLYFAPRNASGQSIPVFVDLDLRSLTVIRSGEPIIGLGEVGTFDDGGIMPCSVVRAEGLVYMYYVGWNPSVSVPYRNSIGLCVSKDDGITFERLFQGPVVDRNLDEPFFTASPCVIKEGNNWKMWYASSTGFTQVDETQSPLYHIKFAWSDDGVHWNRPNTSCIIPRDPYECTARPSVVVENGKYLMWYCYRGSFDYRDGKDSYQIGYAESNDGLSWVRKDGELQFEIGGSKYDNRMTCYPNVIELNDTRFMFYNGNGFGRDGVLCAREEMQQQ